MPNDDYAQNPKDIAFARARVAAVVGMCEAGFRTEAARKDAMRLLNRAHDVLVNESIRYAILSARVCGDNSWIWDREDWHALYQNHSIPALNAWGAKHDVLYADFPAPPSPRPTRCPNCACASRRSPCRRGRRPRPRSRGPSARARS